MDYDPNHPTDEDLELEATINRVMDRVGDVREGSAEYRMIVRQLIGLREGSQLGRLIFEEFTMSGDRRLPLEIYG
jgi:hypothetical protein